MSGSTALQARKLSAPNRTQERVLEVSHWTDSLFSFRISRPSNFRFRSGEFVMIGLEVEGKPLLRAYSIASPCWAGELEFFSIKVPDGALTSRLQNILPDDEIILNRKPVGTLVLDALTPGRTLYLLSSGTGIAPFLSIIRDPETYDKFERVVLAHTCREVAELAYGQEVVRATLEHEFLGDIVRGRLLHVDSATREPYRRQGRITNLISSGELFDAAGSGWSGEAETAGFDPASDRVMICGSMEMIKDTGAMVVAAGLTEGSNAAPAEFVIEKAFVG